MARSKGDGNGRLDRIEEALATMLQNQAALEQGQTAFLAHKAEADRETADVRRELADLRRAMIEADRRIEERFSRIEAILLEHNRILQALPEPKRAMLLAVR